MSSPGWVAIVPVKGAPKAKSRLDHDNRAELAEAFALDTVAALLAVPAITGVYVVTGDEVVARDLASLGAQVVAEPAASVGGDPLNAAITAGADAVRSRHPEGNVAVFTGDLPSLTAEDVTHALALAEAHDLSMVPDEQGTGTSVLFARAGTPFTPRFGAGSRAAHEAAGHHPLDIPATSTIRRDVDTVADLAEALHLGVGPHTSALIARLTAADPDDVTPSR